jgi:hypothetical protein
VLAIREHEVVLAFDDPSEEAIWKDRLSGAAEIIGAGRARRRKDQS